MQKYIEELRQLWFLDWELSDDENVYFSSGWFNGLVEANLNTGTGTILSTFPGEIGLVGDLHQKILKIDNKLYFCPRSSRLFYVYDLKKQEMLSYCLPKNDEYWLERECKFGRLVQYTDYLYLIPFNYNQILRFDINKKEFDVYDQWFLDFEKLVGYKYQEIKYKNFFKSIMVNENICLWEVIGTDYIGKFDITTGQVSFVKFKGGAIVSIEETDSTPIFLCNDGRAWRYDVVKNQFKNVCKFDMDINDIYVSFIKFEDLCYFPSLSKNKLIVYDIDKKKVEHIEIESDCIVYENSIGERWCRQFLAVKKKDKYIYMQNKHNEIVIFNSDTREYKVKRILLESYEDINWEMNSDVYEGGVKYTYFPYQSVNLDILLHRLKNSKNMKKNEKNYGMKIFKRVLKEGM